MMLTLNLTVNRTQQMAGGGTLYRRMVLTECVPNVGDEVFLWTDPVDGQGDGDGVMGGPPWRVKRRYMAHDGSWHVDLTEMVVNPDERLQQAIQSENAHDEASFFEGDTGFNVETSLIAHGGWKKRL